MNPLFMNGYLGEQGDGTRNGSIEIPKYGKAHSVRYCEGELIELHVINGMPCRRDMKDQEAEKNYGIQGNLIPLRAINAG